MEFFYSYFFITLIVLCLITFLFSFLSSDFKPVVFMKRNKKNKKDDIAAICYFNNN